MNFGSIYSAVGCNLRLLIVDVGSAEGAHLCCEVPREIFGVCAGPSHMNHGSSEGTHSMFANRPTYRQHMPMNPCDSSLTLQWWANREKNDDVAKGGEAMPSPLLPHLCLYEIGHHGL